MKNIFKHAFALLFVISLASFTQSKKEKFSVEIWQDSKPVGIKDGIVVLQKKEFQIKVHLIEQEGVYLSSSFGSSYYGLKETDEVPDLQEIGARSFAESTFNEDKDLIIDNEGVSYMFYKPKQDWHRFDKDIQIEGKTVTGTKTIQHLFILENRSNVNIEEVQKPLNLFFVATTKGRKIKELQRLKLQVRWV